MLDHLEVVVGAELGLARVALGVDRQEADDVGQEGERRDLALGVLVQEVVDLPRLVADPQVVGRLADDVVEEHVVGAEDLVHAAERVEGVQVVLRRLALPVRRLRGQLGAGRVDDLALGLEHRGDRRLRPPLDLEVGHRSRSARAIARSRSTWPSPIGEQTHSARRLRSRANSQGVGVGGDGGVHVDELLDQRVDHDRVPAVRQVPDAVQHDQPAAGQLGEASAAAQRLAAILGAVQDEHRTGERLRQRDRLVLVAGRSGAWVRAASVSASVCSVHSTRSSKTLDECGSGSSAAEW